MVETSEKKEILLNGLFKIRETSTPTPSVSPFYKDLFRSQISNIQNPIHTRYPLKQLDFLELKEKTT